MRANDVHKLAQLHRVRASRLVALERDLRTKIAALREIEDEAAACQSELEQAQRQRDAWENEWQSWLRTQGVLSRGEEYNRYHIALTAWERDLREQLTEIQVRQRVAADAVDSARRVVRHAQARLAALAERIAQTRRSIARTVEQRRQRDTDEIATLAARQARAVWSSELASDSV
jgi:chromosome segregation ATPase